MNSDQFKIVMNGDSAITILFNEDTSERLTQKILSLVALIKNHLNELIIDIIPAYQSLTISFNSKNINADKLIMEVELLFNLPFNGTEYQPKIIEIPVCYENEFSPDLESLAQHCKLTTEEVIALHCQPNYLVHMLGFLPGFLYLGGLSDKLFCPRKSTPAISIPAGSVAIGGNQTGIYPVSSPGGWHIIGRTPLNLFDPNSEQPFIANPLDKIKFLSIPKDEFLAFKRCF